MHVPTEFIIEARDQLSNLFCGNRGSKVDIPDRQAGKGLSVARKQAMEKRGAAAQIAQYEKRFFDGLCFVTREENVIQPKEEPMHQRSDRPDQIEQRQKDNSFSSE